MENKKCKYLKGKKDCISLNSGFITCPFINSSQLGCKGYEVEKKKE